MLLEKYRTQKEVKMMSEKRDYRAEVILKAMKDEDFRQKLLDNPKAVIEHELGIIIPDQVNIQVLEEKLKAASKQELTDDELDRVVGGGVFWDKFWDFLEGGHDWSSEGAGV